ncbi:hypothetical protein MMC06_005360 [Schaereria dolodes]|nr:hypothetical protein [Schaereria dolodes]
MASRQVSSRTTANNSSHVRRNLFHHHLSRRPTSASTSTSATNLQDAARGSTSDIVMRDKNGNYQVHVPSMPAVDDEQPPEDEGKEIDRIDARLLEMYKNRTRQTSEPAELLAAVKASLRRKVASLEDDNWIFEAEQEKGG